MVARSDVYIISDLHLCDGSRVEDFRPDDERALMSFLFRLGRAARTTLIINGDFIDFVQIQPQPQMWNGPTLDASEAQSLIKLDRAMQVHGPVFDVLSRFVAQGHALRFHFGNHDIDLVWPQVQARIRERLGAPKNYDGVTFGEAFLEDGLYVEHGHQADSVNSFPTQPDIIHADSQGVLRLERCWGTRLVEEFYNRIEVLDGCDMLDNVRPRLQAAIIIIGHAILDRQMHAMLLTGMRVIIETLAQLRTEQDVANAAEQLGVNRQVLGWFSSVAGWLSLAGSADERAYVAKGVGGPPLAVPSLQTAYAFGANLRDGTQLAQVASRLAHETPHLYAKSAAGSAPPEYTAASQQPFLRRAEALAAHYADVRAVCFGHTHQAITPELYVDHQPGWPLSGTPTRYFNSGSWTRTLNLNTLEPDQLTFAYLTQPEHYHAGRDYLKVTWSHPHKPMVETLTWG